MEQEVSYATLCLSPDISSDKAKVLACFEKFKLRLKEVDNTVKIFFTVECYKSGGYYLRALVNSVQKLDLKLYWEGLLKQQLVSDLDLTFKKYLVKRGFPF